MVYGNILYSHPTGWRFQRLTHSWLHEEDPLGHSALATAHAHHSTLATAGVAVPPLVTPPLVRVQDDDDDTDDAAEDKRALTAEQALVVKIAKHKSRVEELKRAAALAAEEATGAGSFYNKEDLMERIFSTKMAQLTAAEDDAAGENVPRFQTLNPATRAGPQEELFDPSKTNQETLRNSVTLLTKVPAVQEREEEKKMGRKEKSEREKKKREGERGREREMSTDLDVTLSTAHDAYLVPAEWDDTIVPVVPSREVTTATTMLAKATEDLSGVHTAASVPAASFALETDSEALDAGMAGGDPSEELEHEDGQEDLDFSNLLRHVDELASVMSDQTDDQVNNEKDNPEQLPSPRSSTPPALAHEALPPTYVCSYVLVLNILFQE